MKLFARLLVVPALAALVSGGLAATATPASAATTLYTMESQAITLANKARAAAGCNAVKVNTKLTTAARKHSKDMAVRGYFSHVTPEGTTFVQRAVAAGYANPVGENIAWGQRTASEVHTAWMNSDGHRANILNCKAINVGVGAAKNAAGVIYWTQVFGA